MAKKPNITDLLGIDKSVDTPSMIGAAESPPIDPTAATEPEAGPEEDSVIVAHRNRQKSWAEDAKVMFLGPERAELARIELLEQMQIMESERNAKLKAEKEARLAAEEKATAKDKAAELKAAAAALYDRITELETEAERLEKIAKE
jgi:hypothetical protein